MKKTILIVIVILFSLQLGAKEAKYIFFMIGDGMGVNMIAATEYYKAACKGKVGTEPLCFHYFPVVSYATTYNAEKEISDSGSSGTALATGTKTAPSHIGTDPDGKPLTNLSTLMARSGRQVGIITSVKINDATPSVFYGHQTDRNNYMELLSELAASDYAFMAGNSFYAPKDVSKDRVLESIKSEKTLIRSLDEYAAVKGKADRLVFIPDDGRQFRPAINRREGDGSTTLAACLRTTIDFLQSKDKEGKGFFIMAEGGDIDHCAHSNDMAASIKETIDFEDAVSVAMEFYKLHPDETAILVTSDHDTGGASLISKDYRSYALLSRQTYSVEKISDEFQKKFRSNPGISWDEFKAFMGEHTGMWDDIEVKEKDEKKIKSVFENTIAKGKLDLRTDEFKYGFIPLVIKETLKVYNGYAGIRWASNGHTSLFVPVFYQGPQTELFGGPLDNTSFFPILKKVAGL